MVEGNTYIEHFSIKGRTSVVAPLYSIAPEETHLLTSSSLMPSGEDLLGQRVQR